jgi:hypothetical protein
MSYSLIKQVSALPKTADGSRPKVGVPYLSPSQVSSFARCEAAYYAQYAKGRREPGKPVLMLGTGTHRFAEAYHELMMAGRPENELFDGAMHEACLTIDHDLKEDPGFDWHNPVWYKSPDYADGMNILAGGTSKFLSMADLLKARVEHAAQILVPTLNEYEPVRLEQGYFIEWADGLTLPILCFTDLIATRKADKDPVIRVMDYKTSGKAKSAIDVQRNIGLTAYSIGEGLVFGSEMIHDVGFVNIVTTKVMTITTLDDIRIEDDIRRLYNAARVQTLKLRAGLIGISDNPMNCSWCYHRDWCEDAFGGKRPKLPVTIPQAAADADQLQFVA